MKTKIKYLVVVLLSLCWIENISSVFKTPLWSPRDEVQHYDYINCISDGHLPKAEQKVSHFTERLFYTWVDSFMNTRGYWYKSYEANQPVAYYALLAVPNLALKKMDVSPSALIYSLRIISLSIVLIAVLILLYTAKEFEQYPLLRYSAFFSAMVISFISKDVFVSLGNDNLSVLFGAVQFYLFLQEKEETKNIFWMIATASFATFFVKVTNGLLFIPCGLYMVLHKDLLTKMLGVKLVAVLLIFPFAKYVFLPSSITTNQPIDYPGRGIVNFLTLLFGNTFGISFQYSLWVGLLLLLTLCGSLFITRREELNKSLCFQYSTLAVFTSAVVLNYVLLGIPWSAFRHFAVMYPFMITGFIQSFVVLSQQIMPIRSRTFS